MKIIKLGGSLITDSCALKHCLNTIEQQSDEKIVIVPGGGLFADQVRALQLQWKFDDETAHEMAVLAMCQMALICKSLSPSFIIAKNISSIEQAIAYSVVIWSPDIEELNSFGIKASWEVTSDSLAAWLANQLTADELILVKSAQIPTKNDIWQMQKQGILDVAFNKFSQNSSYKITLINKHHFNE